jgi:alpha-glucosidase
LTRWASFTQHPHELARQAAALVLSLRGSVCLYQGEELGLGETELLFEELTDPRGIRFWPEDKGRDGCRTPMPWDRGDAPNGFTTGKPWLPLKPAQSALNVADQNADPQSTLAFYRQILHWRKDHPVLATGDITFLDTPEPILAYLRADGANAMLCVFNLSAEPEQVSVSGFDSGILEPVSNGATLAKDNLTLDPNGYAFIPVPVSSKLAIKPLG